MQTFLDVATVIMITLLIIQVVWLVIYYWYMIWEQEKKYKKR